MLLIAPLCTKSHWQFFGEIAKILANRGHQVTTITPMSVIKHENVTEINVNFDLEEVVPNTFENGLWKTGLIMFQRSPKNCAEVMGRNEVRDLNFEEYDLILISVFLSDCFFSRLENITVPVVLLCPNTIFTYLHEVMGNVDFLSFSPLMGLPMTHPLSFFERLVNVLVAQFNWVLVHYRYLPKMETECQEAGLCRPDMTHIADITFRSSLTILNNIQSLEFPVRPYVPTVIHAGGLNCRPAQPLPKYLADWIEGSGDAGTIYFSLGSAVKPKDMPDNFRQMFVKAFARLPQRVVWKWHEDNMEDLPPNVKLGSWLPQQDILGEFEGGHPKVRLFISHGGLFSTFETIYHAVPMLGLPAFADQGTNMHKSTGEGFAETINWTELSEELLFNTIEKMLTNESYQETVNRRSLVMRDQPLSPQDTVVYWTEYVIRHGGAPHLQSPIKTMSWYVLYNVDVWLFVCVILVVLVVVVVKVTMMVVRKCCCRKAKTKGPHEELLKKKQ
ncbi:UDP-glucuronosyl/UDP-glucosyltransferase [Trinorchestia longiramus]|nr:UDP-glucuronosyl/UDP-glucosyltransferase [Trinorchestia longiramus]